MKGKTIALKSPRDAVRHGFAMCPEDRKAEGIIPELSVRENIILALQAEKSRAGLSTCPTHSKNRSHRR